MRRPDGTAHEFYNAAKSELVKQIQKDKSYFAIAAVSHPFSDFTPTGIYGILLPGIFCNSMLKGNWFRQGDPKRMRRLSYLLCRN